MPKEEFAAKVQVRPGLLQELPRAARNLKGDPRRIHLCFTCDPWPNPNHFTDDEPEYTYEVLCILADHDLKVQTLTKAPLRARNSLRALKACDAHFGVSLVWMDDQKREQWEPGSDSETGLSVLDRIDGLIMAKEAGLTTWASVEPVIDPREALAAIDMLMTIVDEIKVGRLNHMKSPEEVDWVNFAREADEKLRAWGRPYMLKDGLAELLK
jgi:DNA repair photolyase